MDDLLVQGLVSGLLFIAVFLVGKRLTMRGGDTEAAPSVRSQVFDIGGRGLVAAAVVAGLASVLARVLLTAKLKPTAAVFIQDPPF